MPRLTESVPKYRKHKASAQAFVELSSRRYYCGPHGTKASKIQYDRLVAEWLVNGRQPSVAQSAITVVELCARYWKFADGYYRKDGKPTCLHGVKQALMPVRQLYGRQPAAEFGPLALKVVRQQMIDAGKSRTYINDQIDHVRRMFKWGAAEQLVSGAVYQSLMTVSGLRRGRTEARETAPILPVDDATVDATVKHMPDVPADMVRLQRLSGMRPQEVCALRPMDLDRSAEVWTYTPASHKTEHHGRRRVIFLGPQAQTILLRYLAREGTKYCFRPVDSMAKSRADQHAKRKTPLSCGNTPGSNRIGRKAKRTAGERYEVAVYRRAIHRACDRAGIPRWSPNRLRHAAATAVRKQFGLEAAQVLLGHATANVTQIYAERDIAKGIEVARILG